MRPDFRNDPDWQQAHADYVDDERDGEDPDEIYPRRINAAIRMRDIEKRYTTES